MSDVKYRVIYKGDLIDGATVDNVKKKLAGFFKGDVNRVEHFFSGKRQIIMKNKDFQSCKKINSIFLQAGAVCIIEEQKEGIQKSNVDKSHVVKKNNDIPPKIDKGSKEFQNMREEFLKTGSELVKKYNDIHEHKKQSFIAKIGLGSIFGID